MLEHIVKNGETIHDILNMYHLELEEIKDINLHITDLFHLVSGMKIKIPVINKEIEQILDNTESFVQQYYPKVHEVFEDAPSLNPVGNPPLEEEVPEASQETFIHSPRETEPISKPIPKGRPYPGILPPKGPYSHKKR
ncbi:MAG: LysM peptidoglycan-binding domain-containing protein [Anaeroplasmataceae bacterium]|jgi:LysM domain.|nr:LysM peptidoglycan-binding domain-containing protein [Anaeroplasmataceae bacterium]